MSLTRTSKKLMYYWMILNYILYLDEGFWCFGCSNHSKISTQPPPETPFKLEIEPRWASQGLPSTKIKQHSKFHHHIQLRILHAHRRGAKEKDGRKPQAKRWNFRGWLQILLVSPFPHKEPFYIPRYCVKLPDPFLSRHVHFSRALLLRLLWMLTL
jgi:hypothetical protein